MKSPSPAVPQLHGLIQCALCREYFEEDRAQPTCQACPLSRACRYVRCPHCGYENPTVPGWIKNLRELTGYGPEKHDQAV